MTKNISWVDKHKGGSAYYVSGYLAVGVNLLKSYRKNRRPQTSLRMISSG